MKTKTFSILFALVMILSLSMGVFAQDFDETWDENTVLTVFNDVDMVFPDLFADIDSDFLWVDTGPMAFPSQFPTSGDSVIAKAPIMNDGDPATPDYTGTFTYDPCGDGLIKYEVVLTKMSLADAQTGGYYYGDPNTTYLSSITANLTLADGSVVNLGLKKCDARGGEGCSYITYKRQADGTWTSKVSGYLTVPMGIVIPDGQPVSMTINFSDYMTALWPVNNSQGGGLDSGSVTVTGVTAANTNARKNYCQTSLQPYAALSDGTFVHAKYDENTGEARLQVVVRNYQPDIHRQNYVIPAEVFAYVDVDGDGYCNADVAQRITNYTCKYTVYNVANAAPRTDYCKFGEGIAIADHGMVKIDISIDHLSGGILRAAEGTAVPFAFRLGGMTGTIMGNFEPVDFPCPPVTRMVVKDPLVPFMASYPMLGDPDIAASGPYGVYEGGVWGIYQKCGKFAYLMVRIKNDGVKEEVVNLNNTAVAINGGTPMNFKWVLSTIEADKGNKIFLDGGESVILIGRAKVTDIPSQLNSDIAMTGAVNFTDFGLYITGKVYSDHNNTNCVAAPK